MSQQRLSEAMRRMEDTEAALRAARASATAVWQDENLPELVCRLVGEVAALQSQLVAMDAKLLDANPEIARLRGLIKDGCKAGEDLAECPWCIYMHSEERNQRAARLGTIGNYIHALDCPAFTGDGAVR